MNRELPRVLLVDGHSMIFADPVLKALHSRKTGAARTQLVDLLVQYGDQIGVHVVVVFDGRGARASLDETEMRVQIFYSKAGQTADALVERFVAKYSPTHHITVATDDNLERSTVAAFGGRWISSAELFYEINEARRQMDQKIKALRSRRPGERL